MRLTDLVNIGVFTAKKDEEKPRYMKRKGSRSPPRPSKIVKSTVPNSRRIDSYNKLIDRNADDNMIDVVRQWLFRYCKSAGSP